MTVAAQILDSGTPSPSPQQTTEAAQPAANPSFDIIAKMERQLKQRESEWKSKEQKLAEYEARMKEFEGFDENPFAILQKKGWDMEKLNKLAIEKLGDEELDPVARRFKQMEELMAKKDQEFEQKIQERISAKEKELQEKEQSYQVEIFKRDLKNHVSSKKEEYEFVNTHPDGMDLVFDVIFTDLQRQQEAGSEVKLMDFDTAAQKVEAYLDGEASKYLSLNKVKSKFRPDSPDLSAYLKPEEPRTITPTQVPKSAKDPSQLSEQERMQLAIEGIKTGKWLTA